MCPILHFREELSTFIRMSHRLSNFENFKSFIWDLSLRLAWSRVFRFYKVNQTFRESENFDSFLRSSKLDGMARWLFESRTLDQFKNISLKRFHWNKNWAICVPDAIPLSFCTTLLRRVFLRSSSHSNILFFSCDSLLLLAPSTFSFYLLPSHPFHRRTTKGFATKLSDFFTVTSAEVLAMTGVLGQNSRSSGLKTATRDHERGSRH